MIEESTRPATGETIDVTPHPRLLAVLGDIEFAPWQCLAELIDGAFDGFLASSSVGETPTIAITLPSRSSDRRDAQVWINDNGRGMALEHLNGAVSAGWTSKTRYGKLGLFGMGFKYRDRPAWQRDDGPNHQAGVYMNSNTGKGGRNLCA